MFAPNLRRKIFGWLERLKNSAVIRLSHKKIRRRRGACLKIRRGGWRRRLRGLDGGRWYGYDYYDGEMPDSD